MSMHWVRFCLQLKSCWWLPCFGTWRRCTYPAHRAGVDQCSLGSSLLVSSLAFLLLCWFLCILLLSLNLLLPASHGLQPVGSEKKVDVDVRWRCDEISCHWKPISKPHLKFLLNEKWRPSWQKNKKYDRKNVCDHIHSKNKNDRVLSIKSISTNLPVTEWRTKVSLHLLQTKVWEADKKGRHHYHLIRVRLNYKAAITEYFLFVCLFL